jgi:hypothetical protein
MARRSLVDALDGDPFGPLFPSPSWDRWRVFAKALVGAPLVGVEVDVYRACTGREAAPTSPATEAWVVSGRRSGKSRIAAAIACYMAAFADVTRLAAGEVGVVMVIAVDKQQAAVTLSYVKACFALPALRGLVVAEGADSIDLRHRVRVEIRAGSYRSVRGRTVLCAILDEVAFLRDESSALPDVELYRALKPALATTGGLILGISSPWAKSGLLWQKYRRHYGQPGSVLVWQSSTAVMNPSLSAAVIDDALDDDPEAAASEWSGLFRSDLESYVSMAVLEQCTAAGVFERPPRADLNYSAFVDPASGTGRDSFALAIGHAVANADGTTTAVLDLAREWPAPFNPLDVAAECAALVRQYRAEGATRSDAYAAGFALEAFRRHDVELQQDAPSKSELYLALLPALSAGRIDMVDSAKLRAQLSALERRRRAGGRDQVDHRPGGRDDLSNASAGVLSWVVAAGAAWWSKPLAKDEQVAVNVAPVDRERILDRDGSGHMEWMSRFGI